MKILETEEIQKYLIDKMWGEWTPRFERVELRAIGLSLVEPIATNAEPIQVTGLRSLIAYFTGDFHMMRHWYPMNSKADVLAVVAIAC